jgi:hypothetical protein
MEKHDAAMVSPSFPAQLAGTPPILTTESAKKQKMENHNKINCAQPRKGLHRLEDPEIATLDTISTPQCPPAGLRLQKTVPAWPLKRRPLTPIQLTDAQLTAFMDSSDCSKHVRDIVENKLCTNASVSFCLHGTGRERVERNAAG